MTGEYLKHYDCYVPGVDYRFLPKRKGTQITLDQIEREIYDNDGWGQLYVVFVKVEDEFPTGFRPFVDVYCAYEGARLAADYEGLFLVDRGGKVIVGDEEELKEKLLKKWGIDHA